jgi:pimeloyl-ACP methyl ester carboxylesterase
MTKAIVLAPGLEGTALDLSGEEIWPPTVWEAVFGYQRLAKLKNPSAKPTKVIGGVLVFDIYSYLISNLKNVAKKCSADYFEFPYDWRKDNRDAAVLLEQFLEGLPADDITLVCHSNGGIVARLLLERKPMPAVVNRIGGYVGVAVPNRGAPVALAAGLGQYSSMILDGDDLKSLSGDPAFPALYQEFPHPGNARLHDGVSVQDVYDQATSARYGLNWQNIQAAEQQSLALNFSGRPAGTDYSLIVGVNLKTMDWIYYNPDSGMYSTTSTNGDNTVPLWSSLETTVPHDLILQGGHVPGIFHRGAQEIINHLWRVLGCDSAALLAAADMITVNKNIFAPGEPISVTVTSSRQTVAAELSQSLVVSNATIGEEHNVPVSEAANLDIAYSNPKPVELGPPVATGLDFVTYEVRAPSEPGAYEFSLGAGEISAETSVRFVVRKGRVPD